MPVVGAGHGHRIHIRARRKDPLLAGDAVRTRPGGLLQILSRVTTRGHSGRTRSLLTAVVPGQSFSRVPTQITCRSVTCGTSRSSPTTLLGHWSGTGRALAQAPQCRRAPGQSPLTTTRARRGHPRRARRTAATGGQRPVGRAVAGEVSSAQRMPSCEVQEGQAPQPCPAWTFLPIEICCSRLA